MISSVFGIRKKYEVIYCPVAEGPKNTIICLRGIGDFRSVLWIVNNRCPHALFSKASSTRVHQISCWDSCIQFSCFSETLVSVIFNKDHLICTLHIFIVVLLYFYRIDDIDFSQSPLSKFEGKGVQVSFMEYYKVNYGIDITDTNQPLLINRYEISCVYILFKTVAIANWTK